MSVVTIIHEETVARFVLRARRIEAHSLARNPEALAEHCKGRLKIHLAVDGTSTILRSLPENEEVFESLAARVRPLILDEEPIFYAKVFNALHLLLTSAPTEPSAWQREEVRRLRAAWKATALGKQVQAYAMRSVNLDGTDPTGLVPDTVLASGWMYADLVHANPQGWRSQALDFSLHERYAAAVSVFCRLAALTVRTLRLVEQLRGDGVLVIDERVWQDDVVIGATELVWEGVGYTAAPGTEMPEWNELLGAQGGPWTPMSITGQLRGNPANRVRVEFTHADGAILGEHDAAVVHREQDGVVLHWHVLVADTVIFRLRFRTDGEHVVPLPMDTVLAHESHRTQLAATNLRLGASQAQALTFHVGDGLVIRHELAPTDAEELRRLHRVAELFEDLVALEELTGESVGPFTRQLNVRDRIRLRQARQLWRGDVIHWDRELPQQVSPHGVTPQGIRSRAESIDIAGARLRMPPFLVWHPEATWEDQGPAPSFGPEARLYAATLPDGARWLAWTPPPAAGVNEPTQEIVETPTPADAVPWSLTGIDQDASTF